MLGLDVEESSHPAFPPDSPVILEASEDLLSSSEESRLEVDPEDFPAMLSFYLQRSVERKGEALSLVEQTSIDDWGRGFLDAVAYMKGDLTYRDLIFACLERVDLHVIWEELEAQGVQVDKEAWLAWMRKQKPQRSLTVRG